VRRQLWLWAIAAAAIVGAASWLFLESRVRATYESMLPTRPDFEGRPVHLRDHLTRLDAAARDDPGNAKVVGVLARAYHANDYSAEAVACYELAMVLEPGEWKHPYGRALVLAEAGRPALTADAFEAVIRVREESPFAWYWLAETRFKLAEYDAAEKAYLRALEIGRARPTLGAAGLHRFPLAAHAAMGLARVDEVRGDARGGIGRIVEVAKRHPRFGSVHRLLAALYDSVGETDLAKEHLAQASRSRKFLPPADPYVRELTRESRSAAFLMKRAELARLAEDHEWAESLARRALEMEPAETEAAINLGRVLGDQGRSDEALAILADYHQRFPDDMEVDADFSLCAQVMSDGLVRSGRARDAELLFESLIRRFPETLWLHGLLGDVLVRTGRNEEAMPHLEKALEGGEDADTRTNLGTVRAYLKDRAGAIAEFEKVLERTPEYVRAIENLTMAYLEEERFEDAERLTARFIGFAEESPAAHLLRARYLYGAEDMEGAKASLRRVIELDPAHELAKNLLADLEKE